MYDLFVPFEIAIRLKEMGFKCQCFGEYRQWDGSEVWLAVYQDTTEFSDSNYTTECLAPMYQQVIAWLIREYDILIQPHFTSGEVGVWYYFYVVSIKTNKTEILTNGDFSCKKALDIAINKTLDIL